MAELADALDLGSSEFISWGFESPLSHHKLERLMAKEFTDNMKSERKFTVTVSSPSQCKRVLALQISKEEVEKEKALAIDELRRDLKVPGFRKGKVPLKFIEKNYGPVIHQDAVRNLLPAVLDDALINENIFPVGDPKFENLKAEEGEDITVDVEVEVRPDLEIKDYTGVKVLVEKRVIEDKDVRETLERVAEQKAVLTVVDRPAKEGDFVLIDYAPVLPDGEVDLTNLAENYPIDLGAEAVLPEFRKALVGLEIKEETDVTVKYPEDFPEKELAGTEKVFHATVKEIKEKRLPEINDEFAKELGGQFESLAALEGQIKDDLEQEEEKRRAHDVEEKIVDGVIAANEFDVPDAMVDNYIASILEQDKKRRPDVPDEAEREKEVREHFREPAVRTIKKFLILDAIRKQETIELGAEEVEERIEDLTKDAGDKADEVRAYFAHPERRRNLENELMDKKVMDFLREKAEVKVT